MASTTFMRTALTLAAAWPTTTMAQQPTIILRASNVSKAAVEEIAPVCARRAGVVVQASYHNNPAIAEDIGRGAAFDVAVLEVRMLGDLAGRGLVSRGSVIPLAALNMGVATREAGPDPKMDTVAAFERALLAARSRRARGCTMSSHPSSSRCRSRYAWLASFRCRLMPRFASPPPHLLVQGPPRGAF